MTHDPRSDEALLARVGEGDEGALRVLYGRHAGLVFSVAAKVAPRAAAEDVVQEVFLTLWRKHATFDPSRGTVRAWLSRIAKNRALNERRRESNARETSDAAFDIADDATPADEAQWMAHRKEVLHRAVEALPEAQRRACRSPSSTSSRTPRSRRCWARRWAR